MATASGVYQNFIFVARKSFSQILNTAHYRIMNFLPSSKTEPTCNQTRSFDNA